MQWCNDNWVDLPDAVARRGICRFSAKTRQPHLDTSRTEGPLAAGRSGISRASALSQRRRERVLDRAAAAERVPEFRLLGAVPGPKQPAVDPVGAGFPLPGR